MRASELEAHVVSYIRKIGSDPSVLAATLEAARKDAETRKPELEESVRYCACRLRMTQERDGAGDVARILGFASACSGHDDLTRRRP